jgi:hypothetical protein
MVSAGVFRLEEKYDQHPFFKPTTLLKFAGRIHNSNFVTFFALFYQMIVNRRKKTCIILVMDRI